MTDTKLRAVVLDLIAAIERTQHYTEADRLAAAERAWKALAAPAAEPEAMGDADILTVAEFVGLIGPGSRVGESHDAAVRFGRALLTLQSTRLRGGVPDEAVQHVGNVLARQHAVYLTTESVRSMLEGALTAAPQAPAPEQDAGVVRDAWRLLETGDRIESADEVLHDDCVTWGSLVGWEVGATYNTTVFMPIRRKVAAAMSAQGGA